jgi:hypothetical protein
MRFHSTVLQTTFRAFILLSHFLEDEWGYIYHKVPKEKVHYDQITKFRLCVLKK